MITKQSFEDWVAQDVVFTSVKEKPILWLNRDEFVKKVELDSVTLRVTDNTSLFSTAGLDTQLAYIDDAGIIFLRTGADWKDLEEFAVRKINGVWKFSLCSQEIEDVKYCRGAKSEYSRGKS